MTEGRQICNCRPQSTDASELVVAADSEVRQVAVGVGGRDEQPTGGPAGVKQAAVALTLDLRTEVETPVTRGSALQQSRNNADSS